MAPPVRGSDPVALPDRAEAPRTSVLPDDPPGVPPDSTEAPRMAVVAVLPPGTTWPDIVVDEPDSTLVDVVVSSVVDEVGADEDDVSEPPASVELVSSAIVVEVVEPLVVLVVVVAAVVDVSPPQVTESVWWTCCGPKSFQVTSTSTSAGAPDIDAVAPEMSTWASDVLLVTRTSLVIVA